LLHPTNLLFWWCHDEPPTLPPDSGPGDEPPTLPPDSGPGDDEPPTLPPDSGPGETELTPDAAFDGDPDNMGGLLMHDKLTVGNPDSTYGLFPTFDIALHGDTQLVSAPDTDEYASVHVFSRNETGSWVLRDKIEPVNPQDDEGFGQSVALSSPVAAIGVPGANAVYMFIQSGQTGYSWSLRQKIQPTGSGDHVGFGTCVALDDNALVVQATHTDGESTKGIAHVYARDGTGWSQTRQVFLSDGESNIHAVAVKGDTMALGAFPPCDNECNEAPVVHIYSGSQGSKENNNRCNPLARSFSCFCFYRPAHCWCPIY